MKRWLKADEWKSYALCGDSLDYIRRPTPEVQLACPSCPVRRDCIKWGLSDNDGDGAAGVVVAGVWIPEAPADVLDPDLPDWDESGRLEAMKLLQEMLSEEVEDF